MIIVPPDRIFSAKKRAFLITRPLLLSPFANHYKFNFVLFFFPLLLLVIHNASSVLNVSLSSNQKQIITNYRIEYPSSFIVGVMQVWLDLYQEKVIERKRC